MTIAVGDQVPAVNLTVMTADGPKSRSASDLLGVGKTVLFAVPGPFTPTCSARHLPGFIELAEEIKAAGVSRIVCTAVQDIFVMEAWGKASGAGDAVDMAADGNGEFAPALGLELDATAFGLGYRSQRFAMIIEDGVIRHLMVDAPGEFRVSGAEQVLGKL